MCIRDSRGEGAAVRIDTQPDRGAKLFDAALKRVMAPHRAQNSGGQLDVPDGHHAEQSVETKDSLSMVGLQTFCFIRSRRSARSRASIGRLCRRQRELPWLI